MHEHHNAWVFWVVFYTKAGALERCSRWFCLLLLVLLSIAFFVVQPATAQTGLFPLRLYWSSLEDARTQSLAWGDYDGDGDLDLAVGNAEQPNLLYRNDGGMLTSSAVWSSTDGDSYSSTTSIAWGDVDGDGDLDLAVGNLGRGDRGLPSRLYRNEGGELTTNAVWSSTETDRTRSIAWGDVDGDGDLDLAVGNLGQSNRLYRNEGGMLTTSAVWSSTETDPTRSIAWGDVDGDGDLDLAVGNGCLSDFPYTCSPNRLYRNEGGMLTTSAVWSASEADLTRSIA